MGKNLHLLHTEGNGLKAMKLELEDEMLNPRPVERDQQLGATLGRAADGDAQGVGIGIDEGDAVA